MINEVINIGNDKNFTIHQLAELIIALTQSKSEIQFLPPLPEGDMTRRQPDSSKMIRILGKEMISLEEGISTMLKRKLFFLN
jgi:UDP-glucose 4-epimerase